MAQPCIFTGLLTVAIDVYMFTVHALSGSLQWVWHTFDSLAMGHAFYPERGCGPADIEVKSWRPVSESLPSILPVWVWNFGKLQEFLSMFIQGVQNVSRMKL